MGQLMIFSAVYLIVASMSPVMGYYILRLNPRSALNRLVLLISLCLMCWALGFSVVTAAPDEATAALWTRVAAVGYTLVYSFLLHFIMLLTGHTRLLRTKWFLTLLYLPAAVSCYAFVLSPSIARAVYRMAQTPRGWMRTTSPILFDRIWSLYFFVTVLSSLLCLVFWGVKTRNLRARKQANLLLWSFFAAFVLGTFTDLINGSLVSLPLPQLAPIFFLIPLSAIFYCVNRFHLLKPPSPGRLERILSDERRIPVFRLASYGLILGGVTLYLMEHFWWRGDSPVLTALSSVMLLALSVILFFVQRTKRGYVHLELLLILTSMTLTPILTINMAQFGGMTIWAFPIMLILCSLMFNSDDMLLASSVPILFSQIYLAATVPQQTVVVDRRSYLGRMVILLFIVVAAYFIHRIYVRRLGENAAQARAQTLIGELAAGFSLSGQDDLPQCIRELLDKLADYFTAETVLFHPIEPELADWIGQQSCCEKASGIAPEAERLALERWKRFLEDSPLRPDAPAGNRGSVPAQFQRQDGSLWLFIPVYEEARPAAFFYVETTRPGVVWTQDQLVPLAIVSRLVSDALEKRSAASRIRFMAYYDSLTRLPNRQLFHDRAEQAIHLARRNDKIVGVVFLDLDSFKSINDTMGHEGGDLLIQAIGRNLEAGLRKTDTVARFGGDEFLILLNSVSDAEDIAKVADKILGIFEAPILLKGQEIFITASAGISVFPADGEDAETLIKHADIAMYTAKEKGKNQYAFCSSHMKETVQYRVSLSNSLYRALERNEFQVYYQPQVDLRTERITGLEALLRWFHPEYGLIPPLEFIPLAEQTGLINSIGAWVLETACAQTVAWTRMGLGAPRIAVNLSVVQLRNPALVSQVERILNRTGIDPGQVELEITESATTREPNYIVRVLRNLKELGVNLSIDDFGTEYSSLNRLKLLPVDKLKMDMQFVRSIDRSPKDRAISLVIMNLAKNLDLKLVAEGVETVTQLDFLKNRTCDEVQGFYYYKPMPAEEMEQVLRGAPLGGG